MSESEFVQLGELASFLGSYDRIEALLKEGLIPHSSFKEEIGKTGWYLNELLQSDYFLNMAKHNQDLPHSYGIRRVYYIAVEQYVKIGYADNIGAKMSAIRSLCPFGEPELLYSEPGDRRVEKDRHFLLQRARHRHEWFHRKPVEKFLERLKNNPMSYLCTAAC